MGEGAPQTCARSQGPACDDNRRREGDAKGYSGFAKQSIGYRAVATVYRRLNCMKHVDAVTAFVRAEDLYMLAYGVRRRWMAGHTQTERERKREGRAVDLHMSSLLVLSFCLLLSEQGEKHNHTTTEMYISLHTFIYKTTRPKTDYFF